MFGYFFCFVISMFSGVVIIYLSVIFLASTSTSLVNTDVQVVRLFNANLKLPSLVCALVAVHS